MNKLLSDGAITEEKFSIYYSDVESTYIDFGAPNTSVYTESVAYIPIESENNDWTAAVAGVSINGLEYALSNEGEGVISSQHECLTGYRDDIENISNMILNSATGIREITS